MSDSKSPWKTFWEKLVGSRRVLPKTARIADDHVDEGTKAERFKDGEHYFAVYVNEMFLEDKRKWFVDYDPMVCSIAEFMYDGKMISVPFIVGPQMLESKIKKIPRGMIFSNTQVAGITPYKGGSFSLTMVLNSIKRKNYARDILGLVEKMGGSMDLSKTLSSYTKLAGVMLDGVECLLGLDDSKPIVGWRQEFNPNFHLNFKPMYFVLIDTPEGKIDIDKLWVKESRLFYGDEPDRSAPFRSASYVLYSLKKADTRSDEESLSFYPVYKKIMEAAGQPGDESWKTAKSMMLTLSHTLAFHPDLTRKQADSLINMYIEEMKKTRAHVLQFSTMSAEERRERIAESPEIMKPLAEPFKKRLLESVKILDL